MKLRSPFVFFFLATVSSLAIPDSPSFRRTVENTDQAMLKAQDRLREHFIEESFCDNLLDEDELFPSRVPMKGFMKLGMKVLCRVWQPRGPSKRHVEKRMDGINAIIAAVNWYENMETHWGNAQNFEARAIVEGCRPGTIQVSSTVLNTAMPMPTDTYDLAAFFSGTAGADAVITAITSAAASEWAVATSAISSFAASESSRVAAWSASECPKLEAKVSTAQAVLTSAAGVVSSILSSSAATTLASATTSASTATVVATTTPSSVGTYTFASGGPATTDCGFLDVECWRKKDKRDVASTSAACQTTDTYKPPVQPADICERIWPPDNWDDGNTGIPGSLRNSTAAENNTRNGINDHGKSDSLTSWKQSFMRAINYYPFSHYFYGHLDETGLTRCLPVSQYTYLKIYGIRNSQIDLWHGTGNYDDWRDVVQKGPCNNGPKGPTWCVLCNPEDPNINSDAFKYNTDPSILARSNIQVNVTSLMTSIRIQQTNTKCHDVTLAASKKELLTNNNCMVDKLVLGGQDNSSLLWAST